MIKRLKEIERALMILYDELQDLFPETHCLAFSVAQTDLKAFPYMYGYIHIGDRCHSLDHVTDLIDMVEAKLEKNRVLYQNFDRLRGVLK